MLARLGELAALVLDLVEQPHVLDRDHRLVGEGGTSSICLSVKGRTVGTLDDDHAYGDSLANQRNAKQRAIRQAVPIGQLYSGSFLDILDVNYFPVKNDPPGYEPDPRGLDVFACIRCVRAYSHKVRCSKMSPVGV